MAHTIFIVSDIFGHTPALDRLAERISAGLAQGRPGPEKVEIISPYGRFFKGEKAAYDYFKAQSSIPAYGRRIGDRLAREADPVFLMGFSAGAAAVWHLSGQGASLPISGALGFYGSQIRHYPDICPCFDIHLIFPRSEPHFSVDRLARKISPTPRVSWEKAPGLHGFMNQYSQNFNRDLYHSFLNTCITNFLARQ